MNPVANSVHSVNGSGASCPLPKTKSAKRSRASSIPSCSSTSSTSGLIYDVKIDEQPDGKSNVAVEMTMTSPACPAGPQLLSQSQDAVRRLDGVGEVDVKLVMEPPWTPDRMTEDARDQLGIF